MIAERLDLRGVVEIHSLGIHPASPSQVSGLDSCTQCQIQNSIMFCSWSRLSASNRQPRRSLSLASADATRGCIHQSTIPITAQNVHCATDYLLSTYQPPRCVCNAIVTPSSGHGRFDIQLACENATSGLPLHSTKTHRRTRNTSASVIFRRCQASRSQPQSSVWSPALSTSFTNPSRSMMLSRTNQKSRKRSGKCPTSSHR